MTVKELISTLDPTYVDIEAYTARFARDLSRARSFHTDYIDFVTSDPSEVENREVITYELMSEDAYNRSVCVNCDAAEFGLWYGDQEAKVLCLLIEDDEEEL